MKNYKNVDISEKRFEHIIRQVTEQIEAGLKYVDHQKRAQRGPLDVLMVDSGSALVVAELKVVEDDGMLMQGVDYYNDVTESVESIARGYKDKGIDPTQTPRLFLIAPSFSITMLRRCNWIDIPISLFSFQAIAFDDESNETIPVFKEIVIPTKLQRIEVYTIDQKLSYITDKSVKELTQQILKEIQEWDPENIVMDAIKYDISIKVSGTVFCYLSTRRKHVVISTYDEDGKWFPASIHNSNDWVEMRSLVKESYERLKT